MALENESEDVGTRYYGTNINDSENYGFGYGNETPYYDYTYNADQSYTPTSTSYDFWESIGVNPNTTMENWSSPSNAQIESALQGDTTFLNLSRQLGSKALDLLKTNGKYDLAKMATLGVGAKMLAGGNKVETGGYNKPIPKLEAVREQVQYNDPNRAPGSTGRQYFTDTRYVPQGNAEALAAAKDASAQQAAGLQAAAQPAPAPAANPYAGKMNLAYAQQRPTPTPTQGAGLPQIPTQLNAQGGINMAEGGLADAGRYLQGETDGMADKIPSSIDGEQPAALSHGEFVIPADVVSHLGNGNSDAGAQKLYEMMDRIRQARTGTTEQGKEINPDEFTMGGLAAAYAGGGAVQKFNTGNLVTGGATTGTTATPAASASGVVPYGTSASSQLSPWAGEYVTNYLGQGAAAAAAPYQAYTGPLTAGASDLQQQAFAGGSEMAMAGYQPGQFTGAFTPQVAQQYMNPYLQASLDPQLKELQRQSDIARMGDASRLTKAGAFGGSRQAIMESEGRRNLLDKQQDVLGQGYKTAYDMAQQQYAKERGDEEASRQFGANFGLKSIDQLSGLGAVQRGITSEGMAADKAQFEEQRDFMYKMPQYQKDLLQGIPVTTTATTSNTTELGRIGSGLADLQGLYTKLANLGQTPPAPTAPAAPVK
jgi:hypothetical protein